MKPRAFALGLTLLALLGLCSCSSPNFNAVPPPTPTSGLLLTGNAAGSTLLVDGLLTFRITGENGPARIHLSPGKHRVRIERDEIEILNQTVTLAADEVLEITVP